MTDLLSKILIFTAFLCVYIYGTKGRPFNFEDVTTEDQNKFEESDLLKRSKTNSGEEGKGPKENKGNKKQVIDAYHLGPYHHGHPWGTVSQWPGYHWGGHPTRHSGWTGYPSMGGWHKSHISKKNSKKSAHKAALKRHMLPTFSYPSYGFAYPSLGFAAVPFTPSPNPWGYEGYRSKLPAKTSKGQTRSSVKGTEAANKRWWPGYMGGWGGWGLGNEGYPGWSPLGDWGHGYDFGGFGHGWGIGFENSFHPFLRAEIPGKHVEKGEAQKRWWPGYMGGWGGWGLGNGGYPGWGPLGDAWGHGLGSYGYGHGLGLGYGYGHGLGLGYGYARGFHSGKEDDKDKAGPKREFIHQPFGGLDYPWDGYGPFADHDYPFLGHDQYLPYPEALYGDFMPFYGFGLGPYAAGPFGYGGHGFYGGHGSYGGYGSYGGHGLHGGHGFFKSKIPNGKSKKMQKELKKEEEASGRHFIHNFNPGRMGWGGAIYPGHGYHGVFPLLAAHPYGTYGGGFYGPYGPPHGAFGPYHRSNVPVNTEESSQSRQVINYNPGCCGWGGCVYPGCGYIGGWTWPLPCHHHHCGCCPCWTRSKAPKTQELKEEKGKSRQEIESPGEGESNEGKPGDQQTHPHLEGSDLMNSEMQNLAMGFPGIEKMQTPMNLAGNQETQRFSDQEMETDGEQQSSPEPAEATQNIAGMTGITPDIGGNGFRTATLGNMEEQQEGQPQSTEDLMSSFNLNMNPSAQGEAPVESFGETGNPGMYPTGAEEQATETASRRADIPGELIKKQAVAYPYHYLYPYSMMTHGINPYYHYAPINYAQHLTTYPTTYPLTHAGFIPQTLPALPAYHGHPSHSIHVGAPNVNVDVHTTREHVAHNPEKQKGGKLKDLVGEFSEKLKLKHKHGQSSHGKKVTKRQIPSFMSPAINRPMGYGAPLRYPIPNTAGLMGQSMLPSLQQPQPFDMNAMSRSGFPAMQSSVMGPSPLRLAAIRTPLQMRSALTPSQMAFSRQLSGITGISLPFSAQPGMGIVGMASRKKRSSKKKHSKKHNNSTKRQFLAAMPQGFPGGEFPGGAFPGGAFPGGAFPGGAFPGGAFPGGAFPGGAFPAGAFPGGAFPAGAYPSFALPASPFAGAALPAFPYPLAQSLVQPQQQQQQQQQQKQQQQQQQQPLTFKSGALPAFRAKMAPAGLSQMKSGGILGAPRMPMLSPYSGFTSEPNNPFVKVPQFQNANFFSGSPSSPWAPSAPMRESMSGFPQAPEGNQGPMMPEMPQQGEEPFQMNGEQVAGFNPSSIGLGGGPQPSPMFPEGGPEPGSEGPAPLAMGPPQREMASFYQYRTRGAGMMESPRYMQPGLAALKKSAVPSKKHNKGKNSKSRTKIPS